jgi:hypothetical protein
MTQTGRDGAQMCGAEFVAVLPGVMAS